MTSSMTSSSRCAARPRRRISAVRSTTAARAGDLSPSLLLALSALTHTLEPRSRSSKVAMPTSRGASASSRANSVPPTVDSPRSLRERDTERATWDEQRAGFESERRRLGAGAGRSGQGGSCARRGQAQVEGAQANHDEQVAVLQEYDFTVRPALQYEQGKYDQDLLDGLDFLIAEMGKRKMYAVLFLTNNWEWSGGMSQYLEWSGKGAIPVPAIPPNTW